MKGKSKGEDRYSLAVGLVADDLFASGFYENVNGTGKWGELVGWVGQGLPEEDALGTLPLGGEGGRGFEDFGGVGEEATVPEVGAAALEDVDELALRKGRGSGSPMFQDGIGARALEVEG